jgi:DNA-binding Lrp family transcriptional regulator
MSLRARHHAELLDGIAQLPTSELLRALDGERVISVAECARMNGISADTVMRRFRHLVVKITDKRVGVKLKDALTIAQPLDARPSDAA